ATAGSDDFSPPPPPEPLGPPEPPLHAMTQHIQRNEAISSGASSPTTFPSPSPSSGWNRTPQGAPASAQAAAYTRRSRASELEACTRAQQRLNPRRKLTHPASAPACPSAAPAAA